MSQLPDHTSPSIATGLRRATVGRCDTHMLGPHLQELRGPWSYCLTPWVCALELYTLWGHEDSNPEMDIDGPGQRGPG